MQFYVNFLYFFADLSNICLKMYYFFCIIQQKAVILQLITKYKILTTNY